MCEVALTHAHFVKPTNARTHARAHTFLSPKLRQCDRPGHRRNHKPGANAKIVQFVHLCLSRFSRPFRPIGLPVTRPSSSTHTFWCGHIIYHIHICRRVCLCLLLPPFSSWTYLILYLNPQFAQLINNYLRRRRIFVVRRCGLSFFH